MSKHDHRAHYVYRCFDSHGRLIYVGSSVDAFARLAFHRSGSWWSPQVVKVTVKVYPDGPTAREVERAAIRNEIPRWNVMGKWAGRSRWTPDDWRDYIDAVARNAEHSNAVRRHLDRARSDFSRLQAAAA